VFNRALLPTGGSHSPGASMKRTLVILSAFALVLAACSSDGGSDVASLEEVTADIAAEIEDASPEAFDEESILEFAQCMRDNGVEDFEDPDIGADGSVGFGFRDLGADVDRETMRGAFEACQDAIGGISFGPGSFDRSGIEDTLYEFAVCMRDNGYDMPDPDFSNLLQGEGGGQGGGGPFGEGFDPEDPTFTSALEACQDVFGGSLRFGGGPNRRGDG
jgi:hypothetical protein